MARPVRRLGNLPAETTSFVGRKRELADLRKKLATRVEIRLREKDKGQLIIGFESEDDLQRLMEVLQR